MKSQEIQTRNTIGNMYSNSSTTEHSLVPKRGKNVSAMFPLLGASQDVATYPSGW